METPSPWQGERWWLILAATAGLMLAAAFPKLGLAGLAWLAPGMMLFAVRRAGWPFRTGCVAGLAFALGALHWLLFIPVRFYPILGWVALSLYVALYVAVWCWICSRLGRAFLPSPALPAGQGRGPRSHLDSSVGLPDSSWLLRQAWALSCAALWVGLEMIQARALGGFPWNLLGASQYKALPLIQVAAFTGVYGISFLVVWFSVSLTLAAERVARAPVHRFAWLADVTLPILALAAVCWLGLGRITSQTPSTRHLKVALIQPSIPQTMIWDTAESDKRFQHVIDLSKAALAAKPDLLVWPEAATPKMLRYDADIHQAVTNLVRSHGVWLILGADDADPKGPTEADYYNSSFLVNPQGEVVASYRKRNLVIFGEYIPLAEWLPFMKWLSPIGGGFKAGDRVVPFPMRNLGAQTAVLICFEDVFPHLVREYASPDLDFLLNLTNDGWFRESSAQWQHAANAVFRAVENGLPLVRCANNGLTCWIDATGRMNEVQFGDSKDIYGAGFKIAQVPLRAGQQPRAPTFYTRHGDVFGWACLAFSVFLAVFGLRRRPNSI